MTFKNLVESSLKKKEICSFEQDFWTLRSYCLHRHLWSTIWPLCLEWDYHVIISRKWKFRFREKLRIPQESLSCSSNKESGTKGKMYMTLTVVWYDVILITNPVNMVCSDHSVLYYRFGLSKNVFPPLDEFVIPFPPYHISAKLYSPLYQICLFSVPPSEFTSPTHTQKNDRSLNSHRKNNLVT